MSQSLPFKKVKRARLYEEVANQMKQAIYDGQLKPGDKLPSERDLCDLFGVGRPTIREAMRILSIMGLIEIGTGVKGSTVKKVDITQYLDAVREQMSWLIQVSDETIDHLWEVRKHVERGIAHSASDNADAEDFARLDRLMEKMEACGGDMKAYFQLAVEFHQKLAMATKNSIFFIIWNMFEEVMLRWYTPVLGTMFPEGPKRLLEPNRIVLKAVKSGDHEAIDRAMEIHAAEEQAFSGATLENLKD